MRPIRIELCGFLSHRRQTSLDLDGVDAAVILGENGAGKTSLVEAMQWALFGTGRGRSPDAFVSVGESRCRVTFDFELAGEPYRVERQRELGRTAKSNLSLLGAADLTAAEATDALTHAIREGTEPPGFWQPMGGATIAETQQAIEDLLGMDSETWLATSFIGQGRADQFTAMAPAQRKALLAEVLDLARFEQLATAAHHHEREFSGEITGLRRYIADLETRTSEAGDPGKDRARAALTEAMARERVRDREKLAREAAERLSKAREAAAGAAGIRERIEQARTTRDEEIRRREAELVRVRRELEQAEAELARQRGAVAKLLPAEEMARRLDAEATERRTQAEHAAQEGASREHQAAQADAGVVERSTKATAATKRAHELEAKIDRLAAHGASPTCPECGQELAAEIRDQLVAGATDELRTIRDTVRVLVREDAALVAEGRAARKAAEELRERYRRAAAEGEELARTAERSLADAERLPQEQERVALAQERSRELASALEDAEANLEPEVLRSLDADLDRLEAQLADAGALEEAVVAAVAADQHARSEIDEARSELGEASTALGRAQGALEGHRRDLEALEVAEGRLRGLSEQLARYSTLARAFGRDGIPSLITENAVPQIEASANRLLERLTDGRIHVRIDSLRAKKTGGVKETLDITVSDESAERPLETWSGGERQAVDLALRVGLAQALAHRAGRRIETLIVDEGFAAFDSARLQRAVEVIHSLTDEFPVILVVTHLAALADAFTRRFLVTNENGTSRVEVLAA